jgi:hypothetical protein
MTDAAAVFDAAYTHCVDMMWMIIGGGAAVLLLMLYCALHAAPVLVLCWMTTRLFGWKGLLWALLLLGEAYRLTQAIPGGHA